MEKLLREFNEKWKGKDVNYCELIGNTIDFGSESATFCASSTIGKAPIIYERNELIAEGLSKERYIKAVIREFEKNQTKCGSCIGCEKLKRMRFQEITNDSIRIKHIVWNHFSGCNSNCVYCVETYNFKVSYEPFDMVLKLKDEGILHENVDVSFGGGEPTLLPNLERYIWFGTENNWPQILNTSALLYKECITEALSNKSFLLQVSVDSGTPETYTKVKGQSGYNIVWNNIARYCESGGRVFIKYILFSYNSSRNEIDSFIQKCTEAGIKNVVVSAEVNAIWKLRKDLPWEYGQQEIEATTYLCWRIMESKKAAFVIRGNLTKEIYMEVMKNLTEKYLKPWIGKRKLCIWGMGVNGKTLYDTLKCFDLQVDYFGDTYQAGLSYNDTKCYSLSELKDKNENNEICFLVSVSNHEEIYEKLTNEFSENNVKILNLE